MDLSQFKSGVYVKQLLGFTSFIPQVISKTLTWSDGSINILFEKATLQLGALNSFSRFVPDIDLFIRMHVVKEATESSRIEGTQTNIEEALVRQKDIDPDRRDDWQEVSNYIQATNNAIDRLKVLPLSSRLLKETHAILLQGVRGKNKLPGEFRSSQNWIGGASLNDAIFIPPPHYEISRLMGDLENFLHNDDINVPHLIKIAIAHYQFETIHPFLDGNGRIGRLMITLYLIEHHIIERPILYLSDFFEKHKSLYYDNLTNVRQNNDIIQWIRFFLEAITQTCTIAIESLQQIMQLHRECIGSKIINLGKKAPNAKKLLDHLFAQPVVTASDIAEVLDISLVTAYKLLDEFLKIGILTETTGYKRNRFFIFKEYIDLFHK